MQRFSFLVGSPPFNAAKGRLKSLLHLFGIKLLQLLMGLIRTYHTVTPGLALVVVGPSVGAAHRAEEPGAEAATETAAGLAAGALALAVDPLEKN